MVRVTHTPSMRYFIYCRKSTESEDRQILSIDSQEAEIRRAFVGRPNIDVTHVFHEAFSAKAPGRPIFNDMLKRIEKGEAEGIITWHPDRLARNSLDGGRLIFLLDQGKLKDLKFSTFTFENNSQGKFMLSIIFGYSKYYVDNLSENVKRGNRSKVARGWRPNHAPIGYRNDPITKTIVIDAERFPLVRRMFDLALTDTSSLRQIALETRAWGLRTPKSKRMGGKWLAVSNTHHILTNPFYAGALVWGGVTHAGAHEAMVTWDEFERVQKIIRRPGRPSPKKHFFPFTNLIECGECGRAVTAENKINRYGSKYTYYHCTKQRLDYRCSQRSVSPRVIDSAFVQFLAEHTVPEKLHRWVLAQTRKTQEAGVADPDVLTRALQKALEDGARALANLTSLRVRELITEEEFTTERRKLLQERFRTEQSLLSAKNSRQWLEPAEALVWFSVRAVIWYREGDDAMKRRIVKSVSSNLKLRNKILSIEARKGFSLIGKSTGCSELLAGLNEFRNLYQSRDAECLDMVAQVMALVKEHQVAVVEEEAM